MISYQHISIATAFLCLGLFFTLLLFPDLIYWLFQVEESESSSFMLRRAAMLFLGLAVITWLSRFEGQSTARQAICLGLSVTMLALAILGSAEYLRGAAGPGGGVPPSGEGTRNRRRGDGRGRGGRRGAGGGVRLDPPAPRE